MDLFDQFLFIYRIQVTCSPSSLLVSRGSFCASLSVSKICEIVIESWILIFPNYWNVRLSFTHALSLLIWPVGESLISLFICSDWLLWLLQSVTHLRIILFPSLGKALSMIELDTCTFGILRPTLLSMRDLPSCSLLALPFTLVPYQMVVAMSLPRMMMMMFSTVTVDLRLLILAPGLLRYFPFFFTCLFFVQIIILFL